MTGFKQKQGPITYLGCPLFVGRTIIIHFSNIIKKVLNRITGWHTKIFSYGGKVILIKHVLQSLPTHLLYIVTPPCIVLKKIQSLMDDFLWGWREYNKQYHWSSWKNLSFRIEEGGIGFRNLQDVIKAFHCKQWWIFRAKQSLCGEFLKAKYCQRSNPISKKSYTIYSLKWKQLMHNKHKVEENVQCNINLGTSSF